MTISDILEHWATIYKPLSHKPESDKLEDQRFFKIRFIELENIFQRNSTVMQSPLMLCSFVTTGNLKGPKKAEVSHQVWLLAKVHDSAQTLGRFDGNRQEMVANELMGYCEDLVAWLLEVKRTGQDPITKRSFASEPQLMQELQAIDTDSISWGLEAEIRQGQWLVAGVDWHALKPLYNFACGSNGKYITPTEEEDPLP